MRIKLAVVLFFAVGAVLVAYLLLDNRTLSAVQLQQVNTACPACHTRPAFTSAGQVHGRHPIVACGTCHPQNPPVVDFNACKSCHGKPRYDSPLAMHDTHASLSCSHCHSDNAGLKTTDSLHDVLKWLSIGTLAFGLTGITVNFILVNRKTKTE